MAKKPSQTTTTTTPLDAQDAQTVDTSNQVITRLEHARELPEAVSGTEVEPVGEDVTAFPSFMDVDRRVMKIGRVNGELVKVAV